MSQGSKMGQNGTKWDKMGQNGTKWKCVRKLDCADGLWQVRSSPSPKTLVIMLINIVFTTQKLTYPSGGPEASSRNVPR